jgi:putative membrane protein
MFSGLIGTRLFFYSLPVHDNHKPLANFLICLGEISDPLSENVQSDREADWQMRFIKLFVFIIIMIIGAVFAVLNSDPVPVNYYFGSRELPLSLVLTLVLGVGVLLGLFSGLGKIVNLKRELQSLKRRSEMVNKEVNNLRALPLKE